MLTFPQDPVLAKPVRELPGPDALPGGCVYEPKFDGYRALLHLRDEACRVQSRRGHDITEAFHDVADATHRELPAGLVLDGELVVWADGTLDFAELQRRTGSARGLRARPRPASFIAFDLLEVAGVDIRDQPLAARRELLAAVAAASAGSVEIAPQTDDVALAREWLTDYATTETGIEGLVVKGLDTSYRNGTRQWLKYRLRDTTEAVVGAVAGPVGSPDHLVLGRPDTSGVLQMVGTTSALTAQQKADVAALVEPAGGAHPWVTTQQDVRRGRRTRLHTVHLVEPTLVVEVSVDRSTDRGRWRHPARLVRLRPDLGPGEVTPV